MTDTIKIKSTPDKKGKYFYIEIFCDGKKVFSEKVLKVEVTEFVDPFKGEQWLLSKEVTLASYFRQEKFKKKENSIFKKIFSFLLSE